MSLMTLNDLLRKQVEDIFSAEQQIQEVLPQMIASANSKELRDMFEDELREVTEQSERLSKVMDKLGIYEKPERCPGIEGLIEESKQIMSEQGDPAVRDAALIGAAQRIEHYEMAAYGCACTYADELGLSDVKKLLGDNLREEKKSDKKLSSIATGGLTKTGVNVQSRPIKK